MLKRDRIKRVKRKLELPEGTDYVDVLDTGEVDEETIEAYREIYDDLKDQIDPEGPTKIYETTDMAEAIFVASALTFFHNEAEVRRNDDTGVILVFSYGKDKGRMQEMYK